MRELFNYIYNQIKERNFAESDLCKMYGLKLERLNNDYTEEAARALLVENIEWLVNTGVISGAELRGFATDFEFSKSDIYFEGEVIVKDKQIILFGTASAKVSGHSRVRMFDTSTCEAYDSSFISCFGKSYVKAKNCKIIAFNETVVESLGFCLIEKYDESVRVAATSKDLVY